MKLPLIVLLMVVAYPWMTFANRRRVSFANCMPANMDIDVLESRPARSRVECSIMCLNNQACLSASYCKTDNGYTCQLTGSYLESNCSRRGADNGCGRTVMVDPCENGGTFYPHNRTCFCVEGFAGRYCQRRYRVFSVEDRGRVIYTNLRVDSEAQGYALHWDDVDMRNEYLDGLGGAGDETKNLNGARFGTYDNDVNGCASVNNAGWWYNPLGCTKLRFHGNGISWPKKRNGTVSVEETQYVIMMFKKVYLYVEDDFVL